MKAILKYQLDTADIQHITMPYGAEILTVQSHRGNICLWALVDWEAIPESLRTFRIYGTGHPLSSDSTYLVQNYIGTVQELNGSLVWHVFEEVSV